MSRPLYFIDLRTRRLLWFTQEHACRYAEARFLVHHQRQQVRQIVLDGMPYWHVQVEPGQRVAA